MYMYLNQINTKIKFLFISRIGLELLKTVANSDRNWEEVVIFSTCLFHYARHHLRQLQQTYIYNRLFIGIGRVARGRRNRHVSFRKTASVCSRRCQNTFQGICRFADNSTPAVKDNVNIANCRLCQNAVCNSVFPSHTG